MGRGWWGVKRETKQISHELFFFFSENPFAKQPMGVKALFGGITYVSLKKDRNVLYVFEKVHWSLVPLL